jgi:ABC-type nitrate/sulfonate/bicarbonate transport system substrate-binding protein
MRYVILVTMLALTCFEISELATAAELHTVRYGFGQEQGGTGRSQDRNGLGALAYVAAQRKGFFERAGVRLQVVPYIPPQPLGNQQDILMEALAKGEIDMTRSQLSFHVYHVLNGYEFAAVAGNTANQLWTILARPEIKNFADLKGKTVALTWPDDLITLSMLKQMGRHGIKPTDVRILVITGAGPRSECLRFGECDAVAANEPYDRALEAQGFRALGNSRELSTLPFIGEIVNKAWAQSHQQAVVAYIRGFAAAMRFINDPKNADEVRPLVQDVTRTSPEVASALMTKYYYDPTHPYLPKQAELDLEGFGRVIDLLGEYDKILKPLPAVSRFVNLDYAKAAGVQ